MESLIKFHGPEPYGFRRRVDLVNSLSQGYKRFKIKPERETQLQMRWAGGQREDVGKMNKTQRGEGWS